MRLTLTRATNLLSTVKCFIKIYSLESFPLYGGSVYVSHSSTVVLDDIIERPCTQLHFLFSLAGIHPG